MSTPRAVLTVFALIYAAVGVVCIVDPVAALTPVGLGPQDELGRVEVWAMYGGLELGIAMFLAWTSLHPSRWEAGLMACALSIGGLGLGRLAGMLLIGPPSLMMWGLCAFEIGGAAVAGFLARRTPS